MACNAAQEYHVVLTEMDLVGFGGVPLMSAIHAKDPYPPVILMSAHATLLHVMVRSRAFGYLHKPLHPRYCTNAIRYAVQYQKVTMNLNRLKNSTTVNAGIRYV